MMPDSKPDAKKIDLTSPPGQQESLPASTVKHGRRWLMDFFPNLRDAGIRWSEDDASSLAASVSYYLALSLFPMFLLLVSGIGLFMRFTRSGIDIKQEILETVEQKTNDSVRMLVDQVLDHLTNHSLVGGPTGLLAAILAAIGVFVQIDRGFDRIFRIPSEKDTSLFQTIVRVVRQRFSAFLMLVSLGGLLVVLFFFSMAFGQLKSMTNKTLPSVNHLFDAFDLVTSVSANALLFMLIYKILPKRPVHYLDAARGGLLVALIWELGRGLLGAFFIGMRYTTAYGAIGSFIALLLWCYYGISVLFYGAEYVQILEIRREAKQAREAKLTKDSQRSSEITFLEATVLDAPTETMRRPLDEKQKPRRAL